MATPFEKALQTLDQAPLPVGKVVEMQSQKRGNSPMARAVAFMVANGSSNQQISQELGVSLSEIVEIIDHPDTVLRIKSHLRNAENNKITDLVNAGVIDAVLTLRKLVGNSTSDQVKFAACKYIIDRKLGEPPKRSNAGLDSENSDPVEEARQLEQRISELRSQHNLKVTNGN